MHAPPTLTLMDYAGPLAAAIMFVCLMSGIREPIRHKLNAVLVAGACGAYLSGGFGIWELVFPALALPVVYVGLTSYRAIGAGWLMHAAWDALHHLYGNSIWPFMPTSSFGCLLFDGAIAVWFLAGAPGVMRSLLGGRQRGPERCTSARSLQ
ncbi:MAG TPA: DUF6010 family protein [Kofleriaceae bacterium]